MALPLGWGLVLGNTWDNRKTLKVDPRDIDCIILLLVGHTDPNALAWVGGGFHDICCEWNAIRLSGYSMLSLICMTVQIILSLASVFQARAYGSEKAFARFFVDIRCRFVLLRNGPGSVETSLACLLMNGYRLKTVHSNIEHWKEKGRGMSWNLRLCRGRQYGRGCPELSDHAEVVSMGGGVLNSQTMQRSSVILCSVSSAEYIAVRNSLGCF